MSNPYYTHTTYPTPNSPGSSASLRNELENITLGFDLLPTLAANGYKVAMVNSAGTALIALAALQSLAITLSTINSTPIGASSPSTGAFTTVSATTFTGAVVGNASTATALATARTIGGTSFDGTANVTSFPVPGAIGGTTPSTGAFTVLSASTSAAVTSSSASAFAVGLTGATNPAFTVDSSTASQVAGLKVTGAATLGTVAIAVTDSGANTSLTVNAKGTGTIGIGSVSTGAVTITPDTTISGATTLASTLAVNGATISTTSATMALLNTGATTVNAFGAATALNVGAATGTLTVANTTLAANAITASTTLAVTGAATLSSTLAVTGTSTLTGAVTATAGVTGPLTSSSVAITGGSITGITDLAVADGGTGASTAAGALNNLLPAQASAANKYLQSDGTNASWDAVSLSTADITGTLGAANGGTGVTTSTGTTNVVLSNSPTLVTPILGTPTSATLTNATGLPISTGVSGLGTGVATLLATPSSANLASAITDETGSGSLVFATSPTLVTPILGTPTSATLTNATGLPISTGVAGLGTGVATFLATPSSANLAAALTDETGTGSAVFATSPTLVTPILGTPTSATLTNATGLPLTTGVTGQLPVANGGTGTATPSIVAGTNVTVSGTWPNQTINSTASGTGDVVGPASSTDNAFARFDSTTGKLLQNSTGATLSDTGAAVFTGALDVLGNSTAGSNIKLYEDTDNGSNYVAFKAPDTIAANVTWTLPAADGTSAQVLSTNGTGTLSWSTAGGAVTLSNDTSTATNLYPLFAAATSGTASTIYTGNAKLLYKPSTGELASSVINSTNGIVVNSQTVSASYTIASGSSGMSSGPITISGGQSVTISSGSRWVVV